MWAWVCPGISGPHPWWGLSACSTSTGWVDTSREGALESEGGREEATTGGSLSLGRGTSRWHGMDEVRLKKPRKGQVQNPARHLEHKLAKTSLARGHVLHVAPSLHWAPPWQSPSCRCRGRWGRGSPTTPQKETHCRGPPGLWEGETPSFKGDWPPRETRICEKTHKYKKTNKRAEDRKVWKEGFRQWNYLVWKFERICLEKLK